MFIAVVYLIIFLHDDNEIWTLKASFHLLKLRCQKSIPEQWSTKWPRRLRQLRLPDRQKVLKQISEKSVKNICGSKTYATKIVPRGTLCNSKKSPWPLVICQGSVGKPVPHQISALTVGHKAATLPEPGPSTSGGSGGGVISALTMVCGAWAWSEPAPGSSGGGGSMELCSPTVKTSASPLPMTD